MFKIGDEVMDRDGKQYMVMGVGLLGAYEIRDADGNMQAGVLEVFLAKYDPSLAEKLVVIADCITRMEVLVNDVKNQQTSIFEIARRK